MEAKVKGYFLGELITWEIYDPLVNMVAFSSPATVQGLTTSFLHLCCFSVY